MSLDCLVTRTIQVLARVAFTGAREDRDLANAARERSLETLFVRHQDRIPHAGPRTQAAHELVRVGELRDGLRADEARRLDDGVSCVGEAVEELQLRFRPKDAVL